VTTQVLAFQCMQGSCVKVTHDRTGRIPLHGETLEPANPVTVEKDNSLATPELIDFLPLELSKHIPI
jgi:hypothetical protein